MGKKRFASTSSAQEHKTETSRLGSNHVSSHTRGWNTGVEVHAYVDTDGTDAFDIYTTGGSNNPKRRIFVARVDSEGSIHRVYTYHVS